MEAITSFGEWIRLRRGALHLTRDQLAQRVGCAVVTIRKIEADERRPSVQIAELLAQHLAIPADEREAFIKAARAELRPDRLPAPALTTALAPIAVTTRTTPRDRPVMSPLNGHTAEPPPQPSKTATWPAMDGSQPAQPARTATPPDRNRSRMLAKVKTIWITGILEQSLHGAALIELGLAYQHDAVERAWDLIVQRPDCPSHPIPPGTNIIDVFDELGGEVLILGEPGSGKTTTLLEMARSLIARAEQDMFHPMPVVFNLSSWAEHQPPLAAWLVEELNIRYDVPKKIGKVWVETDQILPLLDGLDEVQQEQRAACVDAINVFRQEHGLVHLVVCSRIVDYQLLDTRLRLQGAIQIQPLTAQQIDTYLASAGDQLATVRTTLRTDAALQELARSPLMLSIMMLTYRNGPPQELIPHASVEQWRRHLFEAYTQRMFRRRKTDTYYTAEQTQHWLSWLASTMTKRAQTLFFIEGLQPGMLTSSIQRRYYSGSLGLILGIIGGLVFGLGRGVGLGLAHGLIEGWVQGLSWLVAGLVQGSIGGISGGIIGGFIGMMTGSGATSDVAQNRSWQIVRHGLWLGLTLGLGVGLTSGMAVGALRGLVNGMTVTLAFGLGCGLMTKPGVIVVVEKLRWSWAATKSRWMAGLGIGLVWGLSFGMASGLADNLKLGLGLGLALGGSIGLALGLALGLMFGLMSHEVELKTIPNQGIARSAHHALLTGCLVGLAFGVIGGVSLGITTALASGSAIGLATGLGAGFIPFSITGLIAALVYGGLAYLQHFMLRLILWRSGAIPWNYARFLDYAADRIFLRKVGGGYIFVHRLLLEYYAAHDRHSLPDYHDCSSSICPSESASLCASHPVCDCG